MEDMGLVIITPNGTILDRVGVTYLEVTGSEGILGILPGHAPFVTTLVPAAITFKTKRHEYNLAMSEGVIRVDFDKVTIIADAVFYKNQIDYKLTKELINNAQARLKDTLQRDEARKLAKEIALGQAKLKLENMGGRIRLK